MESQRFGDTAQVGNLFQVAVHLLVAQYRKYQPLCHAWGIVRIASDDFQGLRQQGDVGGSLRFLPAGQHPQPTVNALRSEEHTSELQSLMRISYAVFCLKKKN